MTSKYSGCKTTSSLKKNCFEVSLDGPTNVIKQALLKLNYSSTFPGGWVRIEIKTNLNLNCLLKLRLAKLGNEDLFYVKVDFCFIWLHYL